MTAGGSVPDGGDGRSGSADTGKGARRRDRRSDPRVLSGPVASAIAGMVGVVLVLGAGTYAFVAESEGCTGAALTLDVAAAPELQPALADAAQRFGEQHPTVGGACVTAVVQAADPAQITTMLGQGAAVGAAHRPDVWIPDSSLWNAQLPAPRAPDASVAQSPIVAGMPQALAGTLLGEGVNSGQLSWADLLNAAGAVTGGTIPAASTVVQQGLLQLRVPDPTQNATGLGLLVIADALQPKGTDQRLVLTSIGQTLRDHTVPDVASEFSSLRRDAQGRYPVVIASEQALYAHNQSTPGDLVLADYPREGTLSLDYPYTVVASDPQRVEAARLFEATVLDATTQGRLRTLGFRTSASGPSSSPRPSPEASPPAFAVPGPDEARQIIQAWYKLSLGIRNLSVIDVSASMDLPAGPDLTRLQVAVQASQTVLSILPDDTQLGIMQTDGGSVADTQANPTSGAPIGQLGDAVGQGTRRQQLFTALGGVHSGTGGGLYDSVLTAFRLMNRTYQSSRINSVLVYTAGSDTGSTVTLQTLLTALQQEYDQAHPVQIVVVEIGRAADQSGLGQIAAVTHGATYTITTPDRIRQVVLSALSRRVCTPDC